MKIIKQGQPPSSRIYRFTCTSCETVFEAERSECEQIQDFRDGDFVQIYCPVCKVRCTKSADLYEQD